MGKTANRSDSNLNQKRYVMSDGLSRDISSGHRSPVANEKDLPSTDLCRCLPLSVCVYVCVSICLCLCCLSVLSACLSVCLLICLSFCLLVYRSICMYVCLSLSLSTFDPHPIRIICINLTISIAPE